MKSMAAACALIAVVAGCAAQNVDEIDIACTRDDDCPSETWCDLRIDVCRSLDTSAPPHLVIDGLSVSGGPPGSSITVKSNELTAVAFQLRNDGGSQTELALELDGPRCLGLTPTFSNDRLLEIGETYQDDLLIDPDPGCASPAQITLAATASGRLFEFRFDVVIAP